MGTSVFSRCESLKRIDIPYGVTAIEREAFSDCTSLTSVTLPSSVTSIGKSAFDECYALTDLVLPDSITTIDEYAFYCCKSLTSLALPSRLTAVADYAFSGCENVSAIIIPARVASIADHAFPDENLQIVTFLGRSLPELHQYAFGYAYHFTVRCWKGSGVDEWAQAEGHTIEYFDDSAASEFFGGTFTLPANLTEIRAESFIGTKADTIIIPATVSSIGSRAFADCPVLTCVEFEGAAISIADDAFEGCSGFTFICADGSDAAAFAEANGIEHTAN